MPQPIPIVLRNRKYTADGEGTERVDWHANRTITRFYDGLSALFPPGERFFIRSVKRLRRRALDPELQRAVDAFIAQEAVHSREHDRYNARAVKAGAPVDVIAAEVERLLKFFEARIPARGCLAATAALEHYTAIFAELALREDDTFGAARTDVAAFWRWHAVEEIEHKAVAFDLLRAARVPYAVRAGAMLVATVIFFEKMAEHQVRLMKHDGDLTNVAAWRSLGRYLFRKPGGFEKVLVGWVDYLRPDYHPWDRDDRHLVDAWRAKEERDAAASTGEAA